MHILSWIHAAYTELDEFSLKKKQSKNWIDILKHKLIMDEYLIQNSCFIYIDGLRDTFWCSLIDLNTFWRTFLNANDFPL